MFLYHIKQTSKIICITSEDLNTRYEQSLQPLFYNPWTIKMLLFLKSHKTSFIKNLSCRRKICKDLKKLMENGVKVLIYFGTKIFISMYSFSFSTNFLKIPHILDKQQAGKTILFFKCQVLFCVLNKYLFRDQQMM